MEDKKLLNEQELEQVSGGMNMDVTADGWQVFYLDPGESAKANVCDAYFSKYADPKKLLQQAAAVLDASDRIRYARRLEVQLTTRDRSSGGFDIVIGNVKY